MSVVAGCSGERSRDSGRTEDLPRLTRPALFQPGIISTGLNERDASMTADGAEFYFTVWTGSSGIIVVARHGDDGWRTPAVAPFSGTFSDLEPSIAPDGSRLYFASSRPAASDSMQGDYNIWYVNRKGDSWSEAVLLAGPVNTPENEYYPSVTAAGELYFTSKRQGGSGGEDIWRVMPSDTDTLRVEPVPGGVNTERDEFNAFVAPDGSYLIFSSWGRNDGSGGGDLYISFANDNGMFGAAVNMGPHVNSPSLDYSPYVSPDGSELFFSSRRATYERSKGRWSYSRLNDALTSPGNGMGDIFHVSASVLDSLREAVIPQDGSEP